MATDSATKKASKELFPRGPYCSETVADAVGVRRGQPGYQDVEEESEGGGKLGYWGRGQGVAFRV